MRAMKSAFLSSGRARPLIATLFLAASAVLLFSAKNTSLYVDIELLNVGEMAPTFSLPRLDGYYQKLTEMKGSVVWIIFGRTDDAETVLQLQEARKIADAWREWDLRILFVAQSQSEKVLQEFISKNGCAAAVMMDNGGRTARVYNAENWPTSYLLDKTTRIRYSSRGLIRAGDGQFNQLIGEFARSGEKKK